MAKKVKEQNYNIADVGTENTEGKQHVPFAIVEAYKTIRANLMFLLSGAKSKCVVLSSSNVGEGKSTTAVNLAIAFAQLGSKVLLIDADMRRPSIYKKMKLSNQKGLSSVLVGFCDVEESISQINPYFDIMTSGPVPPNPSELLGSDKMSELLDKLSKDYDYIFIDTPPVNVVSDALVLAPKTEGIIYVVHDAVTTHDELQKALSGVEFADVRMLGIILNGTNRKKSRYRYLTGRYYYKYYSYYGYNYAHKSKKDK